MRRKNRHADNYGKCPLCNSRTSLDFHHWTYRPERGTRLCRDCHNYIHQPDGARPSEASGSNWLFKATEQLLHRHIELVEDFPTVSEVVARYNIPEDVSYFVEVSMEAVVDEDERKRAHRRKCLEEWANIKRSDSHEHD